MFQPKSFIETDIGNITALVRENPLGTLILSNKEGFEVNHIPFVLDLLGAEGFKLRAHIPKVNPLIDLFNKDTLSCVVIFQGANGYITPSWYSTKQKHGKVVPTWNYAVVHIHGQISLVQETSWLTQQLKDLTAQNEADREKQWQVSDAPKEYTNKQLSFLLGIEITSTKIEAKTKASQNQPAENRESVLASLNSEQPGSNLNEMMREVNKSS